jgi:hypothetical protein
MSDLLSLTPQLTNFITFRQAVYREVLTARRDAQFELLDALLVSGPRPCLAELSTSPLFRRRWPSVYAALEDGRLDTLALRRLLARHLPATGVLVLPLDGVSWPHPQATRLAERQYVHQATHAVNGGSAIAGHAYSLLCWTAEAASSWALPLDCTRIRPGQTAREVGLRQLAALVAHRAPTSSALWVVAADGHYGTAAFLRGVQSLPLAAVVRLRRDRVLYGSPLPYRGRGRPAVHGPRLAFQDPASWPLPDQASCLVDPRWGRVELCRWDQVHDEQDAGCRFTVVRVAVHQERPTPPDALWLGWVGPTQDSAAIWRYYQSRWPVEPSIRLRKQQLAWTRPAWQEAATCDRWSWLVSVAQWQLYLARPLVADRPLPWQRAQAAGHLTPARVAAGLGALFAAIGSPARPPQARGKAPGWPPGRRRERRPGHPVVAKAPPGKPHRRRRARDRPAAA